MQIIRDTDPVPPQAQNAAIAIGNFDGLHLGHQEIFAITKACAEKTQTPFAAITFDPYPREFFNPQGEAFRLMTAEEKYKALEALGLDYLFVLAFTQNLASMSAETFMRQILTRRLKARHIVTGDNFCFGEKRLGNCATLATYAAQENFGFIAVSGLHIDGEIVSSSSIRHALREGKIAEATQLLGRPHCITGKVETGEGRGRGLGFATANMPMEELFLPKLGVYAVRARHRDKMYNGVANLGKKPTFGAFAPQLEVHLFDFESDIYGESLTIELLAYLREEQKFLNIDALKAQIGKDISAAHMVHQSHDHP